MAYRQNTAKITRRKQQASRPQSQRRQGGLLGHIACSKADSSLVQASRRKIPLAEAHVYDRDTQITQETAPNTLFQKETTKGKLKKKEKIKQDCKSLLKRRAKHPQDTLFRDESFQQTCDKIRNRNEAIIMQDISRLIVPSAQNLAILGASRLSDLYETVNEGWNNIYPFEGTRPQPDYAVGFDACAFTQEQHRKLQHHIGQPGSNLLTCFLATPRMYFPFLTCEIKCGNEALDIADRQNAHSMTVAGRAVVLLFSLVKRLPEIHREILG
ncbi:MAG: hypothetical protein Q9228_000987 [Teloschistes exilis]